MKTKSALSYFGSDSEVAGELASMLNRCQHVTIPFCGGLSILPHLTARAIVANDMNDLAINFYRVASGVDGDSQELFKRCQHTLSHPSALAQANWVRTKLSGWNDWNKTELAWAYWAECWIGRKGQGGTTKQGGMPSIRRTASGGTNASRLRAAANDLPMWAKHFERCEWEQVCFRKLLPKVADDEGCGIYCDPPWRGLGDGYLHSFTDADHRDLAVMLERFGKTTVVVRYGADSLIRDLYQDWVIIEAASRTQSNAMKGEIWITNRESVR